MCHTTKKVQSTKRRIQKCANQVNRERPEQRRTGHDRNHGRDPGPEPNRPREGGGQGDPPRVRPCNTLGVKHALSLIKAMHKHSHQA